MKKRKLGSIILALVLCVSMFGIGGVTAAAESDSDFTVDANGTLTAYNGSGGVVNIPDKVKAIGGTVFQGCTSLTEITIPSSVTSIGNNAFENCTSLSKITIPSSVTKIGDYEFYGCTSLANITLPSSVTSIAANAFQNCTNLTEITIPSGVTSIGNSAFRGCASLEEISIPKSITSIGAGAFYGCTSIEGITVEAGNLNYKSLDASGNIGSGVLFDKAGTILLKYPSAFAGPYIIPNGVTDIGNYAFEGCVDLTSVTIPIGVTSIGTSGFYGCASLEEISIPKTVASIGNFVFYGCTSLKGITVATDNSNYASRDADGIRGNSGVLFSKAGTTLLTYPNAFADSYIIPSDVTSIESSAFAGCTGLTGITIPSGVRSIGSPPLGSFVFYGCTNLQGITVDADNANYKSLDADGNSGSGVLFNKAGTALLEYPYDFAASYTIPDGVTEIGADAFYGRTNLTSVSIPSSVTNIGPSAFAGCTGLTDLPIPSSVTFLGSSACMDCTGLTSVTIPSSVKAIQQSAFENCTGLREISIPSGVTEIGLGAFENCTSLTSVSIPSGVTSIQRAAFYGCTGLKSVTIPSSVVRIEQYAFKSCTGLKSITILNSSAEMGSGVFLRCKNLSAACFAGKAPALNSNDGFFALVAKDFTVYYTASYATSFGFSADQTSGTWKGYAAKLWTVTFDKNGGDTDASPANVTVSSNATVTLPAVPTRTGYTFVGWNTSADGKGATFDATTQVAGPMSVYAQWTANGSGNGGGSGGGGNGGGSGGGGNGGGSGGGGNGGGSGGGTTTAPTTTPPAPTVTGTTATTVVTPTVTNGTATAAVTASQLNDALAKAKEAAVQTGAKPQVKIEVAAAAGATSVATSLPRGAVSALSSGGAGGLTVSSSLGSLTFGAEALKTVSAATADVTVSVAQTNTAKLPPALQALVGSRPVYEFSVTSGSSAISQFGGEVSVSVPYTLGAGENPNAVVVQYLNADGHLEIVTNGRYYAATGAVVFSTTHFSKYSVGYNNVSFTDVSVSSWYSDAVTFIAARGITTGATATAYAPDATLTRGQFLTLLLRAYGIATLDSAADNFSDAGNSYYTGYLAAAKKLGISNGTGNNKFVPETAITRQEMFTLLYNALKVLDKLPSGDSGKALTDFKDASGVASYAQTALAALVKAGVVTGDSATLTPTATTTRAQMAQVLYKLLGK